ncbi:MAG: hypothetical protein AAGA80_05365 [Cyanobacteria bacterium P01_F01_bin.143]
MPKFPPRLHIIFARKSNKAIIFRRGPSKYVCSIGWDRQTNIFTLGQWLHGRIYERRSDISPDGKYIIYFAMNGKWQSEIKGSWTAISRYPYLKAIHLRAKGDCWNGGGLFIGKNKYWLNSGCGDEIKEDTKELTRSFEYPWHEGYGGECPGVYYVRLQRDGWQLTEIETAGQWRSLAIFEKKLPNGWSLRKYCREEVNNLPGKGCYYDQHELINSQLNKNIHLPDWEWAEIDDTFLYWVSKGKLYSAQLGETGLIEEKELKDFHNMSFEPIKAPY